VQLLTVVKVGLGRVTSGSAELSDRACDFRPIAQSYSYKDVQIELQRVHTVTSITLLKLPATSNRLARLSPAEGNLAQFRVLHRYALLCSTVVNNGAATTYKDLDTQQAQTCTSKPALLHRKSTLTMLVSVVAPLSCIRHQEMQSGLH
jgi:hypothetical protein